MPAAFKHEFVPYVNFRFRGAMPHAKTRFQNRLIGYTFVYILNQYIVADAEKVYAVFVERFSKVRLILSRQFAVGVSANLIDHSTKIDQATDRIAGTTQDDTFHGGLFLKKNHLGTSREKFRADSQSAKPCWTMSKNGSSAVNAAYLGSVTICSLVVARREARGQSLLLILIHRSNNGG